MNKNKNPTIAALNKIIYERRRQVEVHGYTSNHDDEHEPSALQDAAMAFLSNSPALWPWGVENYKAPEGDEDRLVKAGAMIVAQLERLIRVKQFAEVCNEHQ